MQEAFQEGLAPALVLIIYGLIDKVISPLLTKHLKKRNEKDDDEDVFLASRIGKNSADISENRAALNLQHHVNQNIERRVATLEDNNSKLYSKVNGIATTVAVSAEILKRIEESLK